MIDQDEIAKDYMDAIETAQILNVSDSRVRRLCLDGRFEGAIKIGRNWLIPRKSVENFRRLRPGKKPRGQDERELLLQAISEANNLKENTNHDQQ